MKIDNYVFKVYNFIPSGAVVQRTRMPDCRSGGRGFESRRPRLIYLKRKKMDYKKYWHTTSHIMAQAVKRLFPEVKLGTGPAIEKGFYYDFYREKTFTLEDLEKIEEEMKKLFVKIIRLRKLKKIKMKQKKF
jgi:threonyl-tRNA synthetase